MVLRLGVCDRPIRGASLLAFDAGESRPAPAASRLRRPKVSHRAPALRPAKVYEAGGAYRAGLCLELARDSRGSFLGIRLKARELQLDKMWIGVDSKSR